MQGGGEKEDWNFDSTPEYMEIMEYYRNGTLVPFVGAGFSYWAVPGWNAFAANLARELFLKKVCENSTEKDIKLDKNCDFIGG